MIYIIGNDGTPQRVDGVGNELYPVGSIYMSTENTSPASMFGGTWEQIKDKFLLSAGDTYSAGSTGGEATHTLTVDEMPTHNHTPSNADWVFLYNSTGNGSTGSGPYAAWQTSKYTGDTGGSQAHNNMPPYLVVYCWKRINLGD